MRVGSLNQARTGPRDENPACTHIEQRSEVMVRRNRRGYTDTFYKGPQETIYYIAGLCLLSGNWCNMEFSPEQLDAWKEFTNIGAAHAATTLSQMLQCNVGMSVPEVNIVDVAQVGTILGEEITTMVLFQLLGDIPEGGFLVLHFSDGAAIRTANIMCGMSGTDRPLGEMDQSALLEVGNIMISSFLGATSDLLGIMMLPSPPFLAIDIAHAIIESLIAQRGLDVDDVVVFQVRLASDDSTISGNILIFLDEPTLRRISQILESLLSPPPIP